INAGSGHTTSDSDEDSDFSEGSTSDSSPDWDSEDPYSSEEDGSDNDDGAKNSGDLPKLKEGTKFVVLADPEKTLKMIWDGVKAALVQSGHTSATTIRSIDRIEGHSSPWKRMELLCKCARKPTSTPKIANAEKQRPTSSTRVRLRPV
ncbi:unnamed protein product, partial [Laminaria digitata]